jgi:cold shock CspA family protein
MPARGAWASLYQAAPPTFIHETRRSNIALAGTVKFFSTERVFGFIACDGGGEDAFVHIRQLHAAGLYTLCEGDHSICALLLAKQRKPKHAPAQNRAVRAGDAR